MKLFSPNMYSTFTGVLISLSLLNRIYITCIAPFFDTSPIVETRYGLVEGRSALSRIRRPYYSFTKIPYAKPPIGENRFGPPLPPDPWEDILSAQEDAPTCIQKNYLRDTIPNVEGEEDCLYINVYTPYLPDKVESRFRRRLLPVMVFINWGGFFTGYGNAHYLGPDYFMDKDVVLVTFDYRLGVMGFLSTLDDVAPGNWALKDQVAALQWVQDNIENFGGNNRKVTIFGQSAGAASVHYHLLSPQSKGLFHAAISQSSSALAVWAKPKNQIQSMVMQTQAQLVGCEISVDNKALIECLRKVDAKTLVASGDKFKYFDIEPVVVFGPVTENRTENNPNPFITEDPVDIIRRGDFQKVPWIIGAVENEGILRASPLMRMMETRERLNAAFSQLLPNMLGISISVPETAVTETWDKIKGFYIDGSEGIDVDNSHNVQGMIDMIGDRSFIYSIYQSALIHAAVGHQPIWFYNFAYKGQYSYGDYFAKTSDDINFDWGTSHCDDLLYLFKTPAIFPELSDSNDLQMSELMVTMWTNFATYMNPTPMSEPQLWPTLTPLTSNSSEHFRYLNITGAAASLGANESVTLLVKQGYLTERMNFIDSLNFFESVHQTPTN